jgi:sugar phosphate isomerase/epimerase
LAALPLPLAAAKIDSILHGVHVGLHTYSFSEIPAENALETIIHFMAETGIGECILWAPHIEPRNLWDVLRPPQGSVRPSAAAQADARRELGKWRLSISLDYFKDIRTRFADAGIDISGFGASPNPSDEEINRTFEIAEALGSRMVTLGGTIPLARQIAPIAEQHKMVVGLQGRPNLNSTDPDQISKPENYEQALGLSKSLALRLDIGDATGAGFDCLKFVEEHHARIDSIFLKDRRKDRLSVPWGEGDTPVKQILQLIRDKKYPIRTYIDCDYKATGSRAVEVKKCFTYAKEALG